MGTPPAGRVPDPQGWVWPGVLGLPSQALDFFADFRLGTPLRSEGRQAAYRPPWALSCL